MPGCFGGTRKNFAEVTFITHFLSFYAVHMSMCSDVERLSCGKIDNSAAHFHPGFVVFFRGASTMCTSSDTDRTVLVG
jgi:hypothetical protein